MVLFTCNYVVSVWGFLFLWVLGMGYVILLWHFMSLPLIIFQTIVAGIRHMTISRNFCFLCNVLWTICWHYKILIFDVSLDINGQLCQKVKK